MPKLETIILEPVSEAETAEAFTRLRTDLQVGAIVLRECLDKTELSRLIEENGIGFPELDSFQYLFALFSRKLTGTDDCFSISQRQIFMPSHEWHLSQIQSIPMTRVWLHLRDRAEFSAARAKGPDNLPGYRLEMSEVLSQAYLLPTTIIPEPGDAIVFIDRGTSGSTSTSTYHKVDVPNWSGSGFPQRLSVACDITFKDIEVN